MNRSWGGGRNEGTTSEEGEGKGDGNEGTRTEICVCVLVGIIITAPPQSSFIDARIRVSCPDLSSFDKH